MIKNCKYCKHEKSLHYYPHGKDNVYICLSIFPTFCNCKYYEDDYCITKQPKLDTEKQ